MDIASIAGAIHVNVCNNVREILVGPHGRQFREDTSGVEPFVFTYYGQRVHGRIMADRIQAMQQIYLRVALVETHNMTDNIPAFRYAYGRATAHDANFSVLARKVNLARSVETRRWQFSGPIQKQFEPAVQGRNSTTNVMGSYMIGWAVPVDREIVHFRIQTTRTGSAARIAECAVILDKNGDRFGLSANIPTTPDFPQNEIMVFNGNGWIMGPTMLGEFGLEYVLEGNEEVYFWDTKLQEDEDAWDSGVLNYELEAAGRTKRPSVLVSEDREGNPVAALVPSNHRKRRMNLRK